MAVELTEYIEMGRFNSKDMGFYIIEHDSPSPDEQEIVEPIPYMQGVYDFSRLLGERVFDNRKVTVTLWHPLLTYDERKMLEQETRDILMLNETGPIIDSWLDGCHWRGKCESVTAIDDQETNTLTVEVVFDCYPFAFKDGTGYTDEFDIDYFTDGADCWTGFWVTNTRDVLLINEGANATSPIIEATAPFIIIVNGYVLEVPAGTTQDVLLKLVRGENSITIIGTGHISFYMEYEVMV